jgi:protease-4
MIIGLVVLLLVGIGGLGTLLVGLAAAGGGTGASPFSFGKKIALLEVNGVLGEGPGYGADTQWLREAVAGWTEDSSVQGMVIRVNSPGGAVSATHDLFTEIEKFRATGRPVYTAMGDVAASGGYYVAMASDRVYANAGTLTGSVGVILSFLGYEGFQEKLGLESRTIKSGVFKDIGSGAREMTEADKELLDGMVTDVYEQFLAIVLEARADSVRELLAKRHSKAPSAVTDAEIEAHVRSLCDGRIFSGNQAFNDGMIDGLASVDEVVATMLTDLGLPEDTTVAKTPMRPRGLFGSISGKLAQLEQMAPGMVKLEFRFEP